MTYRKFKENLINGYCIQCISKALGTDIDSRKVIYGHRCICSSCGEEHHRVIGLPFGTVILCTIYGKFDKAVKTLKF